MPDNKDRYDAELKHLLSGRPVSGSPFSWGWNSNRGIGHTSLHGIFGLEPDNPLIQRKLALYQWLLVAGNIKRDNLYTVDPFVFDPSLLDADPGAKVTHTWEKGTARENLEGIVRLSEPSGEVADMLLDRGLHTDYVESDVPGKVSLLLSLLIPLDEHD